MASVEMILAALQAGAGGADPELSGAYDELCARVRNAFADSSRALRALEDFLDDPETYERPLVKALSESGVDQNRGIGAAAARVLQLQPSHRKDLVDDIVEREQIRTGDRFTRMAEGISDLKVQEEAASQERMERFWEEEHRRREAIAERQARLWKQQQQMVIGVAAIGIIILVVFIVILIVTASG